MIKIFAPIIIFVASFSIVLAGEIPIVLNNKKTPAHTTFNGTDAWMLLPKNYTYSINVIGFEKSTGEHCAFRKKQMTIAAFETTIKNEIVKKQTYLINGKNAVYFSVKSTTKKTVAYFVISSGNEIKIFTINNAKENELETIKASLLSLYF